MAIYKDDRGVEPGTYPEQHQLVARAGFEPGVTALKSSALTTRPSCLHPEGTQEEEKWVGEDLEDAAGRRSLLRGRIVTVGVMWITTVAVVQVVSLDGLEPLLRIAISMMCATSV